MPHFRLILWVAAGFLLILLPVSISTAQNARPAPILEDHAGGAANGVEVTLAADRAPEPGEIMTLTVTARPLQPAADLQILWELPDGGQLLGGGTEDSLGAVAAGESVTLTRQARFDGPGVYEVRARAAYFPNRATSLAASGVLFFTVRQGAPSASDLDPQHADLRAAGGANHRGQIRPDRARQQHGPDGRLFQRARHVDPREQHARRRGRPHPR